MAIRLFRAVESSYASLARNERKCTRDAPTEFATPGDSRTCRASVTIMISGAVGIATKLLPCKWNAVLWNSYPLKILWKMGVLAGVPFDSLQSWSFKARRPASGCRICRRSKSWLRERKGGWRRQAKTQRDRRRCRAAPPHAGQCPLRCQQAGTSGFFRRTRGEGEIAISGCRGAELLRFARGT